MQQGTTAVVPSILIFQTFITSHKILLKPADDCIQLACHRSKLRRDWIMQVPLQRPTKNSPKPTVCLNLPKILFPIWSLERTFIFYLCKRILTVTYFFLPWWEIGWFCQGQRQVCILCRQSRGKLASQPSTLRRQEIWFLHNLFEIYLKNNFVTELTIWYENLISLNKRSINTGTFWEAKETREANMFF